MSRCYIIAGMHRSGTSLTAALVQSAGVFIGDELIGAAESNRLGHFEDKEFTKLNEKILKDAGGSWHNPPPEENLAASFVENLRDVEKLIEKHKREVWWWKDPRNSMLFQMYASFVENPHLIVCFRNPLSVAKSLNRRDKFDILKGLNLAMEYNRRIIKGLCRINIPHVFVSYEGLLFDTENELFKLECFLGGKCDRDVIKKNLVSFK